MNDEDRNSIVDDTVHGITQKLTEAGLLKTDWGNITDGTRNMKNQEDKNFRVDEAELDGQSLNHEDYIDWENSLEIFFEYRDTPIAAICFEGVQRQRVRENRPRIDS